ncbi:hypothetical protein R84981_001806 [Carnimonas sp. R-84981]
MRPPVRVSQWLHCRPRTRCEGRPRALCAVLYSVISVAALSGHPNNLHRWLRHTSIWVAHPTHIIKKSVSFRG